jgi:internalin A
MSCRKNYLHWIWLLVFVIMSIGRLGRYCSTYRSNTRTTDAWLKGLQYLDLSNTQNLDLNNTQITDAGLKELAGLKNLQKLDLGFTRITDAGLKELAKLQNLRELNLLDTQVTDAGVRELRKALPRCRIISR